MPTPMRPSGLVRDARIPTSLKANGPCTLNMRQPRAASIDGGTLASAANSESPAAVRVTDKKGPFKAQSGMDDSGDSLTIANNPSITERVRVRLVGGMLR